MPVRKPCIEELEASLGYQFTEKGLLAEALTHSSARSEKGGRDNERLEFLGDRVLGLSIAALLFERFPKAREVELARHFNALVCRTTCAEVALKLELGPYLVMAPSEARSGGRKKDVILADAVEALLGAISVDGGFAAAATVVHRHWEPFIASSEPPAPDAKTALQEFAQSQKRGLPDYQEVERSGADHAPSFTVEVKVRGLKPERGTGSSLKKAQQAAAEALLKREGVGQTEQENA
ncbi:ribonuclease III [Rhodomicrobium sp. Az07]|uniref:ribonuclease III n=1 Tax=Rhodomicrobium sp. Az07 TaxID=2839034 RepID=UPI001BEAED29|nr:ribonuclease III [Rhodomicrobium sp. Az07]MBT3071081.1 ribonuclease III [Rhodomicrobium sp. Az07]